MYYTSYFLFLQIAVAFWVKFIFIDFQSSPLDRGDKEEYSILSNDFEVRGYQD